MDVVAHHLARGPHPPDPSQLDGLARLPVDGDDAREQDSLAREEPERAPRRLAPGEDEVARGEPGDLGPQGETSGLRTVRKRREIGEVELEG
ncbi:MAG: hypothetical protein ACF8XB_08390, partial [Planctomycetota bacterium JB042]